MALVNKFMSAVQDPQQRASVHQLNIKNNVVYLFLIIFDYDYLWDQVKLQ